MKKIYIIIIVLAVFSCTNDKKEGSQTVTSTSSVSSDQLEKDSNSNTRSPATINSGSSASNPKQNLVGQWKEHWGIGVETNVNYNDLYKIAIDDAGKISVNCTNKKKYKIDQVLFDGQEISFRKQNKSYPLGRFYVYYKLKLHDDLRWMEGPITNNKKQKDYVKWEKISPKD